MAKFIKGLPDHKLFSCDINVYVTNGCKLDYDNVNNMFGLYDVVYVVDNYRNVDQLLVDLKLYDSTSAVRRAGRSGIKLEVGYNHEIKVTKNQWLFLFNDDSSFTSTEE